MLQIVEQKDLSGYEALLDSLKAPEGTRLYLTEALDAGAVTGHIVYAYEPDRAAIYAVDDGGDLYLCDGLVRSVLFKAQLRGMEKAVYYVQDAAMMARIRSLRLAQKEDAILENINEIMESCKKCKENTGNT